MSGPRTERLTIRLTPEEKRLIQDMAQKNLRKDSDWSRIILLEACAPRQATRQTVEDNQPE